MAEKSLSHWPIWTSRMINKLTQKVDDLDLVLGGHDWCSELVNINDTMICKSGTDFREFSIIKVRTNCDPATLENECHDSVINFKKKLIMSKTKVEITKEFEPNIEMRDIISGYCEELSKKYNQIAWITGVDLDGRYSSVRWKESNISNFVADVVRYTYHTDISIINSGALRTNDIIPHGIVCWKEIDLLLPILEAVWRIRINGATLLKVLENGLSQVPELDGKLSLYFH